MDISRVAKLAIGATAAVGTVGLLAACGAESHDDAPHPVEPDGGNGSTPPPTNGPREVIHPGRPGGDVKAPPQRAFAQVVRSEFNAFDHNHRGGIGANELTRRTHDTVYGATQFTGTDSHGNK